MNYGVFVSNLMCDHNAKPHYRHIFNAIWLKIKQLRLISRTAADLFRYGFYVEMSYICIKIWSRFRFQYFKLLYVKWWRVINQFVFRPEIRIGYTRIALNQCLLGFVIKYLKVNKQQLKDTHTQTRPHTHTHVTKSIFLGTKNESYVLSFA